MTIAVEGGSPDVAPSQSGTTPRQRLIAGRFRLIDQLGRGGMGRVYRAHDEVLDRPVAVKLIYDDAVRDRDLQHACALEARAAARLNHPGIVRILDSGFDDGHCYVVMSLAEGRTLSEILREDGPPPLDRALDLGIQIADALAAAHEEGVIHCDVKPGNLLVDAQWHVRLVDFGIARVTSSTTGLTGELLQGSAQYVAPEQVEGASVDGRTDLYALGTVLYEMLAGKTPFGGGTIASILARRLVNDPPSLRESNPAVPPQVEHVILKALARDPEQRTQTAAELRDALKAVRHAAPVFPIPERRRQPERGLPRWTRLETPGLSLPALNWERPRQMMLTGAARAAIWSAQTGRWARRAAGTTVPDAMTRAQLLTPTRRPTLRSGVAVAVLLGLLVGIGAAKCGVADVSAEAALSTESTAAVQTSPPTPGLAPVEIAPLAESAAPASTEPPPATPVPPSATAPAPTAMPEPTNAVAEEPQPAAAPPPPPPPAARAPIVRAMAAPPAPAAPVQAAPEPADQPEQASDSGEKRSNLSNTPRDDEKTPEERAKADAKRDEAEKRDDPPKPARASTLPPVVSKPEPPKPEPPKPEPPKPEPPKQQAAPTRPLPPPVQMQDSKKPDPPKVEPKPSQPKNEKPAGDDKGKKR